MAIDYACGNGADCTQTHQGGKCYNPDTVMDYCNYAVNNYFQAKGQSPGSCDFNGANMVTTTDPSSKGCAYFFCQIHDVVRYRLHRMKKKLKDELDNKNRVQEYVCPKCGKRYNALDAIRLISFEDDAFHCESCNTELVAESDKIASQDIGDGDAYARRWCREKLRD